MNTRAPLVVLDLDHFIDLITKIHILVKQILNTIDEKKLHKNFLGYKSKIVLQKN